MSSKLSIIIVWVCVIFLLCAGLIMITSTAIWTETDSNVYEQLYKQSLFAGIGIVGAIIISCIDYRKYRQFIKPLWWIATILLVGCYIPGIADEQYGESRWIKIGIKFQPSECAKLVLIMTLAHWYTRYHDDVRKLWNGLLKPGGILFGIPLLLILCEKDMGTAAALGVAGLCVIFVAGVRLRHIIPAIVIAAAGGIAFMASSANRMGRIHAWRHLYEERLDQGLQQWQALIAFQNGGLWGTGLGSSTVKHGRLPFAHTDFIYAPLGEEFGLVGTFSVLLAFTILAIVAIHIAIKTKDSFGKLLAVGIAAIIFCPAMLNIGVVIAALPNSGLPLPFISYGGTNLIFTLAAIGVLTSIQRFSPSEDTYQHLEQTSDSANVRL